MLALVLVLLDHRADAHAPLDLHDAAAADALDLLREEGRAAPFVVRAADGGACAERARSAAARAADGDTVARLHCTVAAELTLEVCNLLCGTALLMLDIVAAAAGRLETTLHTLGPFTDASADAT